ncbi:MAG TPA: hypothetical protein VJJ20_00715 [Candidatus Paceibacterota bacterium]
MDKKYAITAVVLLVLAVGAWALVSRLNALKVDPAVVEQLQWKIVDQGVDPDTGGTSARVFLTIAGVDVPIGGYRGTCALAGASSTPLLSDEVSGVICVTQGSGKEIGIFNEGGKLVLKEGDIEVNADGSVIKRDNFLKRNEL